MNPRPVAGDSSIAHASGRDIRRWIWSTLAALAVAIVAAAPMARGQEGKWEMAKPMLQPLAETASAVVGHKWYVFGGLDGPNVMPQAVVMEYDRDADAWTMKKKMLVPAHHIAAVALGGKIYVFGGFVGRQGTRGWGPIADALEYDPATDSWKELAPMPTPRGSAEAVAIEGKIYVIGGAHANMPGKAPTEPIRPNVPQIVTGVVEEYDPATNSWRSRAAMPTARNHFLAVAVDGKIYAVNGRLGTAFGSTSDVTDLVEEYDPKADVWRYVSRAPTRRGDVAGDVHGGLIYVTAGEYTDPAGKMAFWAFEAYDPKTNVWRTLPHMQIARHGCVAAFIGNEFHVAGGSFQADGSGIYSQMATHEVYAVEN